MDTYPDLIVCRGVDFEQFKAVLDAARAEHQTAMLAISVELIDAKPSSAEAKRVNADAMTRALGSP